MNKKRLLIIDDSDIDRITLNHMLSHDFDIIEAENGYAGLQIILSKQPQIDGVLLDLSMPILDGFQVLQLLSDHGIEDLPVIIITADSTESNVIKTISYHTSDFIRKPFEPKVILPRLRTLFQIQPPITKEEEILETNESILRLENIYKTYLENHHKDDRHFRRVSELMKILLEEYAAQSKNPEPDKDHISFAGKAAYFYNIGEMVVPDAILSGNMTEKTDKSIYESHTLAGAKIIQLNTSPSCSYFTQVCGDICTHHHERFDGRGFPHGLKGNDNSVYAQLCALSIKFDQIFVKRPELTESQFDFVIHEIKVDEGNFSQDMISLLMKCREKVLCYYKKIYYFNK